MLTSETTPVPVPLMPFGLMKTLSLAASLLRFESVDALRCCVLRRLEGVGGAEPAVSDQILQEEIRVLEEGQVIDSNER